MGAAFFCLIVLLLGSVWIPLAPTRLFDFDAANFALALDDFQPAAHQPQPPGYPLYVGLTQVIHVFVADVPFTFLVAGLLGSAVSVLLLWLVGRRIFGERAGLFGALLLMTNPILWQTAMSDQVRIYIAVISISVALALWPGWEGRLTARRLAASAFLLGLLAGFRPEMLVSLGPLPVLAALRSRMRVRYYPLAAGALAAGMAPWFIVLLMKLGGFDNFLGMMRAYSAQQAGGSSLFFGASWAGAWGMFAAALWWASLGVAAWIPAAFLVRWRKLRALQGYKVHFLLAWFLPLFLFSVFVHIAASGHALGFIPALCLIGGWVLSAIGDTRGQRAMLTIAIAALVLNVILFFKPYAKSVREASYKTVGVINGINERTLGKIDDYMQQGPVFLVTDSEWIPWRILQYSYPNSSLLYLQDPMAAPGPIPPVWLIQNRRRVGDVDANSEIMMPSCGTIVWLISDDRSRRELLMVPGADAARYFIATPSHPGMHVNVGRYRLATSAEPCPAQNATLAYHSQ